MIVKSQTKSSETCDDGDQEEKAACEEGRLGLGPKWRARQMVKGLWTAVMEMGEVRWWLSGAGGGEGSGGCHSDCIHALCTECGIPNSCEVVWFVHVEKHKVMHYTG